MNCLHGFYVYEMLPRVFHQTNKLSGKNEAIRYMNGYKSFSKVE